MNTQPATSQPPEPKSPDFHFTNEPALRTPDFDTEHFFQRAGFMTGTERAAVARLIRDLKKSGAWNKLYLFYPFVGGTAESCALNLVSDLSSIVWHGDVTFGNGIAGDGLTGYGQLDFSPGNFLSSVPLEHPDQFNFVSFRDGNAEGHQVVFGAVEHRDPNNPAALVGRTIVRDNGLAGIWMGNFGDWRQVTWAGDSSDAVMYVDSDYTKNQPVIATPNQIITTGQYMPNMRAAVYYAVLAENHGVFDGTATPAQPQNFFTGTVTSLAVGAPLTTEEIPKFMEAVNRFLTTLGRNP